MHFRVFVSLFLLSCIAVTLVTGRQAGTVVFPPTHEGKLAQEYFRAFNSNDDSQMRQFFSMNQSPNAVSTVSLDERMARYREFHKNAGTLTPVKLLPSKDDQFRLMVANSHGEKLFIEFHFESAEPNYLVSISVTDTPEDAVSATRAANDSALVDMVGQKVQSLVSSDDFSGVVLIAKRGKPIFRMAYGFADKEKRIANTLETRFNLGSIIKSFTAVTIYRLVEQGKIQFSDPIKKFLPDYPNNIAAEKVTIRHLLNMTSGIGDFFGERYETTDKSKLSSIRAYFPLFADQPLLFEPGSRNRYSNGGFIVLGAIIEAATGTDYYSYVKNNLLLPAGMSVTDWYEKNSTDLSIARGYTKSERESNRRSNYDGLPQRGSSAGGGYSTAGDLLLYAAALGNAALVPALFPGRNGLGIAGGAPGINAALEWNPQTGYAIIVLSNYDPPTAESLARTIRLMLPE